MFLELYTIDLSHIANLIDVDFEITKRVYDLDSANFKGLVNDIEVVDAKIFRFCDEEGNCLYAGLVKNLIQDGNYVSFKGEDFKKILDTDIILNYAETIAPTTFTLKDIFEKVEEGIQTIWADALTVFDVEFVIPEDYTDVTFIGNYYGQFLVVNALSFLKVYLAYYRYYINAEINIIDSKIVFTITQNEEEVEIKREDFETEIITSDVVTNKAIATIQYDNTLEGNVWVGSTADYYESLSIDMKDETIVGSDNPELYDYADNLPLLFCLKLQYPEPPSMDLVTVYYQVVQNVVDRPALPEVKYFLGKDNEIYEDSIPTEQMIIPVRAKVFQSEFLSKAQLLAVMELVNNRYLDNVMVYNTDVPISLIEYGLLTLFIVYDKSGVPKTMPLTEIHYSNDVYKIKLGFKKILLTEVIRK